MHGKPSSVQTINRRCYRCARSSVYYNFWWALTFLSSSSSPQIYLTRLPPFTPGHLLPSMVHLTRRLQLYVYRTLPTTSERTSFFHYCWLRRLAGSAVENDSWASGRCRCGTAPHYWTSAKLGQGRIDEKMQEFPADGSKICREESMCAPVLTAQWHIKGVAMLLTFILHYDFHFQVHINGVRYQWLRQALCLCIALYRNLNSKRFFLPTNWSKCILTGLSYCFA